MNYFFFASISNLKNRRNFSSDKIFRVTKVTKFFLGDESLVRHFLSDKVINFDDDRRGKDYKKENGQQQFDCKQLDIFFPETHL